MTEQQEHPQPAAAPPQEQAPHQGPYQTPYPPPPPYKRLTRTTWDAPISGVCGGIARYLGVDPTLVRVLVAIAAVVTFPAGIIAYAVAWAVMPKE
jgi:phage shock protein C